ncbi:methenyltetrahydromethanopterin cyclohydrolase [Hyphomicrobium sp.]|uniref:methenyltetrahydromethanopterin cyclohydrolase n=1 Tax=Hyphomicrobium sp. TaxID=82 RepID=UPI000FAA4499|nr:methenyltetrahydromethanopterin cyclohydrolase [Hyphomicrobium sp.]RUO97625.1 MAG: methenyltetrahydromethanopterin cyclohydrolase [Hyphomicrobium sp.]
MVNKPSVSARATKLVESVVSDADALRIEVTTGSHGERLIDMGAKAVGGLEAGRRLGEICMGGLGQVAFTQSSGLANWPLGVVVTSNDPVIACLGSQYAGWSISDEESGFFALGSGPARAISRVEDLFQELGYTDRYPETTLVIEGDKAPPPAAIKKISENCGINPRGLTIIYATTWSFAGTVQIASRVLEVAIHKAHALHFPLENILDGMGTTPIAPPVPDFVKAMGRTNDAIIYGGRIHLFVKGPDSDAQRLAESLPASNSDAYGKPFAEIFADVKGDFYKIDPMLFSPAQVVVSNVETGNTFRAGELAPGVVDASFR